MTKGEFELIYDDLYGAFPRAFNSRSSEVWARQLQSEPVGMFRAYADTCMRTNDSPKLSGYWEYKHSRVATGEYMGDDGPTGPEKATDREIHALFSVVTEVMQWHRYKIPIDYPDGSRRPIESLKAAYPHETFEEWIQGGKQSTGNPLWDYFLQGSIIPYRDAVTGRKPEALYKYYADFATTLRESRMSRMKEMEAKEW